MNTDFDRLTSIVFEAIKKTKDQIDSRYRGRRLFGYALCVDDDISGVYHVACTTDWVEERRRDFCEIGYLSVEWEQSGDDSEFDRVNAFIRKFYEENRDNFEIWRDRTFGCFVIALKRARAEGMFDSSTHLSVGSTDPSRHMEMLEAKGIDEVNPPELADTLIDALGFHEYREK